MRHHQLSAHLLAALLLTFLLGAGLPLAQPAVAQSSAAPIIGYGQSIAGAVTSPTGSEHLFTGCVGETVTLTVEADGFAPRLELYAADEDEALASAVAPANATTIAINDHTLAAAGPYIIVVSGRSRGDRGDYTLTLAGTGPDNSLPDDVLTLNLRYGDNVNGTIAAARIEQWNFRGCAGDEISVELTTAEFVPTVALYSLIAESAIATADLAVTGNNAIALLRRTLPANGSYNLVIGGLTPSEAGDYSLRLELKGRTTITPVAATPTATVSAAATPTPTATSAGPRPRRGIPTPKASTTPNATPNVTPNATPTPTRGPTATFTPTPTPEFIMPGVGESAFRILDVSSAGGPINHVAYSPDGVVIATAGEDGAVRVWDAFTGELVQTLTGHTQRVNYVDFAPNDEWIASAGDDGTVRLWDQLGRQVALMEMPDQGVNSVEFSPDNASVVTTTDAGDVLVWDVPAASISLELSGHQGTVYHAVYSPDGTQIATGDSDGVVRVWNSANGTLRRALPVNAGPGSSDPILSVAFDNSSEIVIAGGVIGVNKGSVHLWNVTTGEPIAELVGHQEWGSIATLSPDDAYIFSAGRAAPGHDGPVTATARIWNVESGTLAIALVGYPNNVITALFEPDGSELLTSDGNYVYIWPAPMIDVAAAIYAEPVGVLIPVPTITATPRATPMPTSAATRAPTPTLIPTATVTPAAPQPTATPTPFLPSGNLEIFCTVITERLNLRPGPGTQFNPPIDVLAIGDLLIVVGRNAESTWLQVAVLDENLIVENTGWVSADFLFCVGDIEDAPVVEAP